MAFASKQTGLSRRTGHFFQDKEIVLSGQQGRVAKRPGHRGDWYPDDKKIEVATLFAVTRSIPQSAKLAGVRESVARKWRTEAWFLSILNQVVYEKNEQLDGKITDILEKCTDLIWERLSAGDVRVNWKTGEQYVVPLDARGLAIVYGIMFDKRQLLRGEATSRHETINTDQKLLKLREEFEKFSNATTVKGEVIHDDDSGTQDTTTQEEVLGAVAPMDTKPSSGEEIEVPSEPEIGTPRSQETDGTLSSPTDNGC